VFDLLLSELPEFNEAGYESLILGILADVGDVEIVDELKRRNKYQYKETIKQIEKRIRV
jgi:hypothetical protein